MEWALDEDQNSWREFDVLTHSRFQILIFTTPPPSRHSSKQSHMTEITQIILGTLGVGFMLVYFRDILVPFVVAVFIVYLLVSTPLVDQTSEGSSIHP
jgi:hypothetical protein